DDDDGDDDVKEVCDNNNNDDDEGKADNKPSPLPKPVSSLLAFEVKSSPVDDIKEVTVEGVTIVSSTVNTDNHSIQFQVKVTVRAVLHDDYLSASTPQAFSSSPRGSGSVGGAEIFNFITDDGDDDDDDKAPSESSLPPKALNVVTSLQVIPVLTIQKYHHIQASSSSSNNHDNEDESESFELMALEMAAIPDKLLKQTMDRSFEKRLSPMLLALTLTHAFTISVKSVTGHSREDLDDNINLQSDQPPPHDPSPPQQQSVINMTKAVQWGYLPNTELSLPLSIGPHEAYSTIVSVNAGEEMQSRAFVSPVSVTGYVGTPHHNSNSNSNSNNNHHDNAATTRTRQSNHGDDTCRVVVAGDAHWTTKLVAVEPADAFRIHMTVERNVTTLGQPFSVKLRIFNLSLDSRDLMLLLAKNELKSTTQRASALKEESVNSAVVSEADGYTFGVWGISEDDDGTVRLNRDYDLLAIDAALVLGNVEGQHAVDANLRLVPLKLGRTTAIAKMSESSKATFMKAAVASGIEDYDTFLDVRDDWPQPTLATARDGKTGKQVSELPDRHLIVKVLACALAPGDCRVFKGKTDLAQLPKHGRPYVIGSDICGIVTEIGADEDHFQVGDKIIARFDEPQPHGMCAEYACVKTRFSEKFQASIPAIQACTLPASAAGAKLVATRYVSPGNRVLLFGASGGVGTFLCQYIKLQGASFLAATTTQTELAASLGVDRVIDYRKENWWELDDLEQPFDIIIDLVNGNHWYHAKHASTKVLKKRLPYVQLFPGVETELDLRGLRIVPFMLQMMSGLLYNKLNPWVPKYFGPQVLDLQPGDLKSLLQDVEDKKVRVVLDEAGPFPFDTASVRKAMKLQGSIHAHGKVVIEIAKEEQ
ncbi:MAG: hypothetical protein SGILL_005894, partial [Bacillariaceae sp.]